MMKTTRFVALLMLVFFLMAANTAAQEQENRGSLDLLDRAMADEDLSRTRRRSASATLAVGAATPGVTMVGVLEVLGPMLPAYQGNFFIAPADFPTSWYPFDVTGAFGFGGMLPFGTGITVMVGAGVKGGPFTGGMATMWDAFGAATFPAPPGMTPMVFGGQGLFAPGALPVNTPQGIACGIFNDPVAGPHLGGLTMAPSTRAVHTFNGPPAGDFLAVGAPALIHYVAGCYVSGATVPVELQSFQID